MHFPHYITLNVIGIQNCFCYIFVSFLCLLLIEIFVKYDHSKHVLKRNLSTSFKYKRGAALVVQYSMPVEKKLLR